MTRSRSACVIGWAALLLVCCVATARARTWLGVQDQDGRTWARVKFVNLSASDSHWAIWNCRTAVASAADAAEVNPQMDWDGTVEANSEEVVWVYGVLFGDVQIANADGGASEFRAAVAPSAEGDAELVITIAEDGAVSLSVEAVEAYGVPAVTGELPSAE